MRRIAACFVMGMVVAMPPALAQGTFLPYETVAAAVPHAQAIRTADINGDGRDDVVVANTRGAVPDSDTDYTLNVYLQQADGRLAAPIRFSYDNYSGDFVDLEIVDFTGDGADDVVVVHPWGISWMFYAIYSTSPTRIWSFGGSYWPVPHSSGGSVVAVDVDLDGYQDIVALASSDDSSLRGPWVFYNGRNQHFEAAPAPLATPGHDFNGARVGKGDLNGDGRQDLVFSSPGSYVMLHDGVSGFAAPTTFSADRPYHAIGDFNDDNRDDVALRDRSASPYANLLFYLQNASATFDYVGYTPLADTLWKPVVADVDGDGDDDLLTASPSQNTIDYYRQPASGRLVYETTFAIPSRAPFAAGDVNGDGRTDVVLADAGGLGVLYGREYEDRRLTRGNDFNGDGISDLLWRRDASGQATIWRSALSNASTAVTTSGLDWYVAGTNDFDGDGRSDLLFRNRRSGSNVFWKSGNSATPHAVAAVTDLAWTVAGTGDFDADGRADILWRNTRTGANAIWRSASSATPLAVTGVTNQAWQIVAVGDFDDDGRSDIFWRNASTGINVIWRSGNSATQISVRGVTDLAWRVVGAGDFDGDGRCDVLWRNAGTGVNVVWNSANYETQQLLAKTDAAWKVATTGDFDGDGRSDIVWRSSQSGANVLWKGAHSTWYQVLGSVSDQRWQVAD